MDCCSLLLIDCFFFFAAAATATTTAAAKILCFHFGIPKIELKENRRKMGHQLPLGGARLSGVHPGRKSSLLLLSIPFCSGRALVSSFPTKRFFLISYYTALTIIGHPTAHTIDDESMIILLFFVLLRSSFCCSFDDYPRKLGSRHSLAHPTNISAAAAGSAVHIFPSFFSERFFSTNRTQFPQNSN